MYEEAEVWFMAQVVEKNRVEELRAESQEKKVWEAPQNGWLRVFSKDTKPFTDRITAEYICLEALTRSTLAVSSYAVTVLTVPQQDDQADAYTNEVYVLWHDLSSGSWNTNSGGYQGSSPYALCEIHAKAKKKIGARF
ncbi:hypothetical protein DY000_02013730 [Brassica cretica]|uniref:Uncharacterized protein n=1 Tax=Brassica cretica TaxID=69181 RepID=A0ABQ7D392_BRACR|nr:hypothetical protein DY000_02013730 [Brassica cretica]